MMNSDRTVTKGDETSSVNEESSSTAAPVSVTANSNPDMKRSAVKGLIERYFFQLQRGCGNPKCSNTNCASSGKVVQMTVNEIAAKALQLFSQDAKLCDFYSQPPKVARTHNESPTTSSRSASSASQLDTEMLSPNDSSGSSSSSSGTITSGSSNSTSSTTSTTTNSSNTNISSCAIEGPQTRDAHSTASTSSVVASQLHNKSDLMPRVLSPLIRLDGGAAYTSGPPTPTLAPVSYLNEQLVDELLEECAKYKTCDRLLHAINEVYSSVDKLSLSFHRPARTVSEQATPTTASKLQELIGKTPLVLKKEELRTLEGENDKDEDTQRTSTSLDDSEPMDMEQTEVSGATAQEAAAGLDQTETDKSATKVDLESLRRVKKKLFDLKNPLIGEALNDNIILLAEYITFGFDFTEWDANDEEKMVHCFVICFDMATNTSNSYADLEYLERSLPKLCHAINNLPTSAHARLARIWAAHCTDTLQSLVQCCQQLITLQVILDEDSVQEDSDVMAVTKVLKIAFYANILAGQLETRKQLDHITQTAVTTSEDDDIFFYAQTNKPNYLKFAENKLEKELGVCCMDCRVPLLPFEDFYNEPLSDAIQMDRDYLSYKNLSLDQSNEDAHFSFMLYSFILTPATKVIALYYDSRIRMYSERTSSLYSLLNYFGDESDVRSRPDLKLKVRRDNIIDDALIALELVAMSNPKDLKKQLVVEFQGEQGIDEGGVSKEFFQLIVEEIFNPDFGMFTHQEDTNTVWFNATPFENEAQFTLVGIILGLAIYNNIILAVNFPMVVYRKLMGGQGTFHDLKDWNPTLYRSLKSMLDYQNDDIEDVFMQTFKINYTDVFGEVVEYELKPDGGNLTVGNDNKQEFVDLYSDYLLNKNIERQFRAFRKGFDMVTDESPLKLLFRAEEVEMLVCGSRKFDFIELEKSTEYEGGYTKDTQIIIDFWNVVHSMPEESKRKLLEFTTGSDRVPVGGLSRLKLLITRHGPDSDRLPTSHTCFNVLLLPEYTSREKLEERLLKAINYSKGFGML